MTKSADTYAENYVHTLKVDKKDNKSVLWIKMHDIQGKLGAKSLSDLAIKAKAFMVLKLLQKNRLHIKE